MEIVNKYLKVTRVGFYLLSMFYVRCLSYVIRFILFEKFFFYILRRTTTVDTEQFVTLVQRTINGGDIESRMCVLYRTYNYRRGRIDVTFRWW